MRQVIGGRAKDKPAACTSEMSWFETEVWTERANLLALRDRVGPWVDRAYVTKPLTELILDLDSSESPTHGE